MNKSNVELVMNKSNVEEAKLANDKIVKTVLRNTNE